MNFPSLCVDNFFDRPDEVKNYASTLKYKRKTKGDYWPGERTESLHILNPTFHNYVCMKVLSMYYPFRTTAFSNQIIHFQAASYFQKIEKFNEEINTGWVHRDIPNMLSSIIYLSKNCTKGTSIYRPKKLFAEELHGEWNSSLLYGNKNVSKEHVNALKESNDQFEKTTTFKGIYNRAISFDAAQWHAADGYGTDEEERLTMVIFFQEIVAPYFPIGTCHRIV